MLQNNIIRNISAGFLLIVFAFCVTPKTVVHDLIADHKDAPFTYGTATQQQVQHAGFRCNCDNLVVESPFISDFVPPELVPATGFQVHPVLDADNVGFSSHFFFTLRGPPSIG